jgi:hypothetical protein
MVILIADQFHSDFICGSIPRCCGSISKSSPIVPCLHASSPPLPYHWTGERRHCHWWGPWGHKLALWRTLLTTEGYMSIFVPKLASHCRRQHDPVHMPETRWASPLQSTMSGHFLLPSGELCFIKGDPNQTGRRCILILWFFGILVALITDPFMWCYPLSDYFSNCRFGGNW